MQETEFTPQELIWLNKQDLVDINIFHYWVILGCIGKRILVRSGPFSQIRSHLTMCNVEAVKC